MRLIDIKNEFFKAPAIPHPHHHDRHPEPHPHAEHVPPHLRPDTGEIQFVEEDLGLLTLITEDIDTAASVIRELRGIIPPETQDVIYQLFRICHIVAPYYRPLPYETEDSCEDVCISKTECDHSRYPAAVLDRKGKEHFRHVYPEFSEKFLVDLSFAPHEIATISRFATFIEEALYNLLDKNGGEDNEDH